MFPGLFYALRDSPAVPKTPINAPIRPLGPFPRNPAPPGGFNVLETEENHEV